MCLGILIFPSLPSSREVRVILRATRSVHGAACLTSSSDGRRTRRYPKHEIGHVRVYRIILTKRRRGLSFYPNGTRVSHSTEKT